MDAVAGDLADHGLRAEIRRLGEQLGDALARQEGEPFLDLIERVRAASKAVQRGEGDSGAIHELGRLELPDAIRLVRAFNSYFHLANLAEQVHRFDGVASSDVVGSWLPDVSAAALSAVVNAPNFRDKVTVKELEDQRADTTYLVMLPDLQDGASVSG